MRDHGSVTDEQPPSPSDHGLGQGVQPTGRRNARLKQTVRDMVLSMIVVLAVVGVIMLIAWRPDPDPVKVVDPQMYVSAAASQTEYEVVAPKGLGSGWRATSVRLEPVAESLGVPVLHIGFVTPEDQYARLAEVKYPLGVGTADEQLLSSLADGIELAGVRAIEGTTWMAGESSEGRALALLGEGRAVVISGTAEWSEMEQLARSLEAVQQP